MTMNLITIVRSLLPRVLIKHSWIFILAGVAIVLCCDIVTITNVIVQNICYSYIAGFIFYIPTVLLPLICRELHALKLIEKEKQMLNKHYNRFEEITFNGNEIPSDAHLYAISARMNMMDTPHTRDLKAMNSIKPIKRECLVELSDCNNCMGNILEEIRTLQLYREDFDETIKAIQKCRNKYTESIQSGVMFGEMDHAVTLYLKSFAEVKNIIRETA